MMRTITTVAVALTVGLLMAWGVSAERHNAEREATQVYGIKSLVAPAEPLLVQFEENGPPVVGYSTGWKPAHNHYRWAVFVTREWAFVSGRVLGETCPALKEFAFANSSKKEMSPEALDVLSLALRNKPATLMAHVPRFKAEPAELEKCLGYSYDAGAGLLRIGGKAVALLAGDQTNWARPPSQAKAQ